MFTPAGQTGELGKGLHNALCPTCGKSGTVRDGLFGASPSHLRHQPQMSYAWKPVPTETLVAKISLVALPVPAYR